MYIYICIYIHIYIYVCVCLCMCVCMYLYLYISWPDNSSVLASERNSVVMGVQIPLRPTFYSYF